MRLATPGALMRVDAQERCERAFSGMKSPLLIATVTESLQSVEDCRNAVSADEMLTAVPGGIIKCEVKNEASNNLCVDYSLPPGVID
mmetsp:Transcript_20751/g.17333  ORF Transcript_20751/g.17333 Transcript_20751/m.17333 type:complete len:87 (-) Transcript_20751:141-401(-)